MNREWGVKEVGKATKEADQKIKAKSPTQSRASPGEVKAATGPVVCGIL